MNWRNGLFRLWLVGSLCWGAYVGWSYYEDSIVSAAKVRCFDYVKEKPSPPVFDNPFSCFDPKDKTFELFLPIAESRTPEYAKLLAVPIALTLVLGSALIWVWAGFKGMAGKP
jgi:hypothetical protein